MAAVDLGEVSVEEDSSFFGFSGKGEVSVEEDSSFFGFSSQNILRFGTGHSMSSKE